MMNHNKIRWIVGGLLILVGLGYLLDSSILSLGLADGQFDSNDEARVEVAISVWQELHVTLDMILGHVSGMIPALVAAGVFNEFKKKKTENKKGV